MIKSFHVICYRVYTKYKALFSKQPKKKLQNAKIWYQLKRLYRILSYKNSENSIASVCVSTVLTALLLRCWRFGLTGLILSSQVIILLWLKPRNYKKNIYNNDLQSPVQILVNGRSFVSHDYTLLVMINIELHIPEVPKLVLICRVCCMFSGVITSSSIQEPYIISFIRKYKTYNV